MEYAKQLRVLVVEPSLHLSGILRDALENILNIPAVTLCRDAGDARNAFAQSRVNLLIVKVGSDWPDGVALIEEIRAGLGEVPNDLPIIAMMASPTASVVGHLRDLGVNEILALPLTAKAVSTRIQSVFERPRDWIVSTKFVGPDRRRKKGVDYRGAPRRGSEAATTKDGNTSEPVQATVESPTNLDEAAQPSAETSPPVR